MFAVVEKLRKQFFTRYSKDRTYYRMVDSMFGFCADNIELYKLAIIHRSASIILDDGTHLNNERLEFLGDAIIEAVVSDYLFVEFPECREGDLTKMRSKFVSRFSLNRLATEIGLDRYLVSTQSGDNPQKNIAGDAFEAMMGAIYLDKGYDFVNRLLINDLLRRYVDVEQVAEQERDFKSRLLEWCQKTHQVLKFNTRQSGTGTQISFESVVNINGIDIGRGSGLTKKEAEQNASSAVLPLVVSDELGDYILSSIDHISNELGKDAEPK